MIISASRRTDLPAFYGQWFSNRLAAGWCLVPNPFNSKQVSRVPLTREEVDAFVFWTKNPRPFFPVLDELDRMGHRYYFQFTLNHYPRPLEPALPPLAHRLAAFRELSDRLGPERVVWRYDPIVISGRTDWAFHAGVFRDLCAELAGSTRRVMLSLVHPYAKTRRRLARLEGEGFAFHLDARQDARTGELLRGMAQTARAAGLEPLSCAADPDWSDLGISPGACVDGGLISRLWGGEAGWPRHIGQRGACGCSLSRDIGMNHTCRHDCAYCYATVSEKAARRRHQRHQPDGTSLIPLESDPQGSVHERG
jgi:hypothetical protein